MLTCDSQYYRRFSKLLLSFWLLANSMVFCAFATAGLETADPKTVASETDSIRHIRTIQAASAHHHETFHSSDFGHSSAFGHMDDVHQISVPTGALPGRLHPEGMLSSGYSLGDMCDSHGVGHDSVGHDSDCCGEAKATTSAGTSPADLPASAIVLILLTFCFGSACLHFNSSVLKQPCWSPPPILLLHCSFLK